LPPIFTIGLGLTADRDEVNLLRKLGQHADCLFLPHSLPSDIPNGLFRATVSQMVLFSPDWTCLDKEEIDKLDIPIHLSWLEHCFHVTELDDIEADKLPPLNEPQSEKLQQIGELSEQIKFYVTEYVTLSKSYAIADIDKVIPFCLQLVLQTAIRRLLDFTRQAQIAVVGRSTTIGRTSSCSNLTTMTSYNSLASTSTSASCETVASNAPAKLDMGAVLSRRSFNPRPKNKTKSIQVISVHLPETPTKPDSWTCTKSPGSLIAEEVSSKLNTSQKTTKIPAGHYAGNTQLNLKKETEVETRRTLKFSSLFNRISGEQTESVVAKSSVLSPNKWRSSSSLFLPSQTTLDQSPSIPVENTEFRQSIKTCVQCLSQSTPDIRLHSPHSFNFSIGSVSQNKTATYASEAAKRSVLLRPLRTEPSTKHSFSGDQTNTSLSYELYADPSVSTVRDLLRLKLLSRILIELTTRLGSTQAEVIQLLPVFHDQHVIQLVNHVIDQAVAITLTYRMNQLTSSHPSIPLSQLVTSSPVSVGLIMDKILLDSLNEVGTSNAKIPSFPSYTHLYRHVTSLIDTIIQANESLRINPRTIHVRSDTVRTVLILLWNSAYPAACLAMNRLLNDQDTSEEVISSYLKRDNSQKNVTDYSNPSLHNDIWTTRVSNVPCNIPLVRVVTSAADSKLTRMGVTKFQEAIVINPRQAEKDHSEMGSIIKSDRTTTDLHSHSPCPILDVTSMECFSPPPVVNTLVPTECHGTHYVSVQSSRSGSLSSGASTNDVCLSDTHREDIVTHNLKQTNKEVCFKFQLNGSTDEYNGMLFTQPNTAPTNTRDDELDYFIPTALSKAIQLCPMCTNQIQMLIGAKTWRFDDVMCESNQKELQSRQQRKVDVGVQFDGDHMTDKDDFGPLIDEQFRVPPRRRDFSLTPEKRDSATRMVLECMIAHGRSPSQGAVDDRVSAQSLVYHSMSLSMCDTQPEHCSSPIRNLLGPETGMNSMNTIKLKQRSGDNMDAANKRPRQWVDSRACEIQVPKRSECQARGVHQDENNAKFGFQMVQANSIEKKINVRSTRSPKQSGDRRPSRKSTKHAEVLSMEPFYSCLKELRDRLSRAESRLNTAFSNYLMVQNKRLPVQPRGDLRSQRLDEPTTSQLHSRKKLTEKSRVTIWDSSSLAYISKHLLGKPRCQPVSQRKHSSHPNSRTRMKNSSAVGKPRLRFDPAKTSPPVLTEMNEARWTVDEIRSRGPGLFPSPNMELPVRANNPVPKDGNQLTMLGKITARRDNPGNDGDRSADSVGLPREQQTVSNLSRIGTILAQNGSRNTQRLCTIQKQTTT
uniref:BRCT domain-containing protein n=1 Tax=Echinostoma caproni TaxID=27848 RepID=A0A183AB49_9TREM